MNKKLLYYKKSIQSITNKTTSITGLIDISNFYWKLKQTTPFFRAFVSVYFSTWSLKGELFNDGKKPVATSSKQVYHLTISSQFKPFADKS